MGLILHRLIKRDLRTVLTHYEGEVGPDLAACFQREFEDLALRIERNPRRFHFISGVIRRANFPSFPYHLLYGEIEGEPRAEFSVERMAGPARLCPFGSCGGASYRSLLR